VHVISA